MPRHALLPSLIVLACLGLAACGKTELGKGGSEVTGSAGSAGTQGPSSQLKKCTEPVAVVALVENPRGYGGYSSKYGLPETPVPLLRLLMQQSGCFRVVDRNAGLNAAKSEQELADSGMVDPNTAIKKRKAIAAQFSITPNLVFSENNAGQGLAGVASAIPGLNKISGAIAGVKLKEAQVVLFVTDNETTEQLSAAEGSAKITDLGAGGLVIGGGGGAGAMGWTHSNEGKLIAAAFLDALNKLVPQMEALAAKSLPAPVATKAAAQ